MYSIKTSTFALFSTRLSCRRQTKIDMPGTHLKSSPRRIEVGLRDRPLERKRPEARDRPRILELDGVIVRCRCELLAVRREGDRADPAAMPLERCQARIPVLF